MDPEKRKTLIKIPLLVTAVTLFPTLLLPKKTSAFEIDLFDFDYEPYNHPDETTIRRILSYNLFPNVFSFYFKVPKNTHPIPTIGGLDGDFTIDREYDFIRLQIKGDHSLEKKLTEISEYPQDHHLICIEKQKDLIKQKEDYNRNFIVSDKPSIAGLVKKMLSGIIKDTSFVSKSASNSLKEYNLKITKQETIGKKNYLVAKIEEESSKVKKIEIVSYNIDGLQIPIEIQMSYKVKIKKVTDPHTFKAVLQER